MPGLSLTTDLINATKLSPIWKLFAWTHQVNFTMQPQTESQWCWAATSTSTSHFYNPASSWTQCTVVNAELAQSTCCDDGSTAACNQPWYLDKALDRTENLRSWNGEVATPAEVDAELAAGNPVGVRIGWDGGGGHFMVLSAYQALLNRVEVRDPIYGTTVYDYETFRDEYQGTGSWTHTYYLKQAPRDGCATVLAAIIRQLVEAISRRR